MTRAARITAASRATADDLSNSIDPSTDKLVSVADVIYMIRHNSAVQAEICRIVREEFHLDGGTTPTPTPQPVLGNEE